MKHYKRSAVSAELKPYCHFAKEHDMIEVCEWSNGEGYDVSMSREDGDKNFTLSHGELQALIALTHIAEESD